MRVILTEKAEKMLTQLSNDYSGYEASQHNNTLNKCVKKSNRKPNAMHSQDQENQIFSQSKRKSLNMNYPKNFFNEIDVKTTKLKLPKHFHMKYNEDHGNNLTSHYEYNPLSLRGINSNHPSIKDIITEETYYHMIDNLKQDKSQKRINFKFNDYRDYRTRGRINPSALNIKETLNFNLPIEYDNIIRNLEKRKSISYSFLKKLANYDREKLMNLNQICKKIEMNERNENLNIKLIRDKINSAKKDLKINTKKSLVDIESTVDQIRNTIESKRFSIKSTKNSVINKLNSEYLKIIDENHIGSQSSRK